MDTMPHHNQTARPLSEDAERLLIDLKRAERDIDATGLMVDELARNEPEVLSWVVDLMKAGFPIRLSSDTAPSWEGYAVHGFNMGMASTPEELAATQQVVDQHIGDMQAARAGLQRAAGILAG